jgi:ribosomal protein S18 acetylase RimI-like enzyme
VFNSNHAAIDLYRKLGFVLRRRLHLAVLARASGNLYVSVAMPQASVPRPIASPTRQAARWVRRWPG